MADETNAVEDGAKAAVDVMPPAEEPKKRRAPRRLRATTETAAVEATAKAGKGVKARKKREPKAIVGSAAGAAKPVAVSAKRTRAAAKPASAAPATVSASAADEMAELLRLEEENKGLRQALAEKLRAENADLRKRLGFA